MALECLGNHKVVWLVYKCTEPLPESGRLGNATCKTHVLIFCNILIWNIQYFILAYLVPSMCIALSGDNNRRYENRCGCLCTEYVELGSVDLLVLDNHVKPGKLFNDVFDTCIIEY
jgi:hypothetical protein